MKWDKYLRLICAQSGISFDALDLNQFEGCETKLEVNKLLFSNIKNLGVEIPPGLTEGMKSFVESVTAGGSLSQRVSLAKAKVAKAERDEALALDAVDVARSKTVGALSDYYKALEYDPREALAKSLEAIQKMPEWTYKTAHVSGGYLAWETTNNVVCCYKNAMASVDLQVDLGKFEVRYYPSEGCMRLYESSGNTKVDGYIHPHLGSSGDMCWGTAKEAYREAMQLFEPHRVFPALWYILCNYNDESPYVALRHFKRAQDALADAPSKMLVKAGNYWVHDYWFSMHVEDYGIEELSSRTSDSDEDEYEHLVELCGYAVDRGNGTYEMEGSIRYYFSEMDGVTELLPIDRDSDILECRSYFWSSPLTLEEARKLELHESEGGDENSDTDIGF